MDEYNYSGRFFAFGCSFTINNSRPTWADIVGQQFSQYQNWARGGSGNQYIFNSLIECHQRNKFTADDTVMIMWSGTTREDRYVAAQNGWIGNGNIYWQQIYDKDWVKKFACERGYLIRDLATIAAARDLLDYWGIRYEMMSMTPIHYPEHPNIENEERTDILNVYKDVIAEIKPSVYEVIFNSQNWNLKMSDFGAYVDPEKKYRDAHPDPKESLEYVQRTFPNMSIKLETLEWIHNFKYGTEIPYVPLDRF